MARTVIEGWTGLTLEHADKFGGVDYRSIDGTVAIEVTRLTDEDKRKGRDAALQGAGLTLISEKLRACWFLTVPETQPRLKGLITRVLPHLLELERVGQRRFFDQDAGLHVLQGGELRDVYLPLLRAGVVDAHSMDDTHLTGAKGHHLVALSLFGGTESRGSDVALEHIEGALTLKQDNFQKLCASGANQRHLFVWIDDDTPAVIARPLRGNPPQWDPDRYGLPGRPLMLDTSVTHLWIVHERTGHGWLWDGSTWSDLPDVYLVIEGMV